MVGQAIDMGRFAEPEDYPVTLSIRRVDNDAEVWRKVVKRPAVVEIPPAKYEQQSRIYVRFEYPDGEVIEVGKSRLARSVAWLGEKTGLARRMAR